MIRSHPWDNYPSVIDGQLAVALHLLPHEAQGGVLAVEMTIHVLSHLPNGGVLAVETRGEFLDCPVGTSFGCFVEAVLQSVRQSLDGTLTE